MSDTGPDELGRISWKETELCTVTMDGTEVRPLQRAADCLSIRAGDTIGQYVIDELVGEGGHAVIYRGHDTALGGRPVALKFIKPSLDWNSRFLARFQNEARVLSGLDEHNGIVKLYQFLEYDKHLVIVMELVRGITLHQQLQNGRRFDVTAAVRAVCQVLDGLSFIHANGVIHRDISMRNVLWCERLERYRLIDFGVAKMLGKTLEVSLPGVVVGTIPFMAPEQARAAHIDGRSDLFSAAVVLYVLITGECPHPVTSTAEVIEFLRDEREFAADKMSKIEHDGVRRVLRKALRKRMSERYGTADEMLEDIVQQVPDSGYLLEGRGGGTSWKEAGHDNTDAEFVAVAADGLEEPAHTADSTEVGWLPLAVAVVIFVALAVIAMMLLIHGSS